MFNRKLKQRVDELEELVTLLDSEVRYLNYEREQAKNPDKLLIPPRIITHFGLSIYDLKKKYRGSHPCNY